MLVAPVAVLGTLGAAGCARATPPAAAAPPWTLSLPAQRLPTIGDLRAILRSDPGDAVQTLQVAAIPVEVFDIAESAPRTSAPPWVALRDQLCGAPDGGLLAEAIPNGWTLTVTGYIDSSGPSGPGTLNDTLDEIRANAAADQIAADCHLPRNGIRAAGGDLSDDDTRKVVVSFTRTSDGSQS